MPSTVLHTNIAHVSRPSTSGTHTHTQYIIRVSDERAPSIHWTVYRRYSEFRAFKLKLEDAIRNEDMCSHCAVMAKRSCFMQFPRRRLFSNLKDRVLEDRRMGLNAFLDAVTKHARTCKDRVVCQTRPLMDQFLMVNDMRYTYLDVDMDVRETRSSNLAEDLALQVKEKLAMRGSMDQIKPLRPVGTAHVVSNNQEEEQEEPIEIESQEPQQPEDDPQEDRSTSRQKTARPRSPSDSEFDGRVLTSKHKPAVASLLAYTSDRSIRSARHSLTERERESFVTPVYHSAPLPSLAGRHSDPGAASPPCRLELLNFSRNSFSGCSGGSQRSSLESSARYRARKVHLSSAAKRIKRLEEEQETRLSSRQARKPKKMRPLTPILEQE